jgi:hypothetical protein
MSDVNAILEIRRRADGAIRRDPDLWRYSGSFIWEDGNFACDCNRRDFFTRAAGEEDPEDDRCGRGAFDVRLTSEKGAVLYEDGDEWPEHGTLKQTAAVGHERPA